LGSLYLTNATNTSIDVLRVLMNVQEVLRGMMVTTITRRVETATRSYWQGGQIFINQLRTVALSDTQMEGPGKHRRGHCCCEDVAFDEGMFDLRWV
jgi:hypothetical protein